VVLDTAFKQQRLKAWQPILTPKTVLPTLFIIGVIFAPIGGLLIWGSSLVSEMTFDYTDCEKLTPSASNDTLSFSDMPPNKFSYRLRSSDSNAVPANPRYAFLDNTSNSSVTDVSAKRQCVVEFNVPAELDHTVLFYYKLTNFFQNHRRYVKSLDSNQLKGTAVSIKTLNAGDCKPLATKNNTAIYPCGLIANSLFNGPLRFNFSDL
jgi:LEM3 (ligand-effect modulator 3) family / CDC50 family